MDYLNKAKVIDVLMNSTLEEAIKKIQDMDGAKVDERVEAVWWEVSDDPLDPRLQCSNCQEIYMPQGDEKRCPYCGAYILFDNRLPY